MRLLLDTHVWAWMRLEPHRVSRGAAETINAADHIVVSVVTAWEILTDRRVRGLASRLDLPMDEATAGFPVLPIMPAHVAAMAAMPWLHRDPFDRMLVAQAQAEGLVLVTADRRIRAYDVAVLPA